jgi:hypothetical protein
VTCVVCGANMATAQVCRECGAWDAAPIGKVPAGSLAGGRRRRSVARILGVTFVVILNVVALWLAIVFPAIYVTQASHAQLGADYVPLWAALVMAILCGSVPAITLVWVGYRWRRARQRRMSGSDSPVLPPGCVTICAGQGLFLRADESGLLVRNFYFGRKSRIRITWAEISYFADGHYTKQGSTSWMLLIVLRTGKTVGVLSSVLASPVEVVATVGEAAQAHGIPADLAGVPVKNGRPQRGLYQDPGGQPGLRYWDGGQWSPLLPLELKPKAAKGPTSWSELPLAARPWTSAATLARRWTIWFVSFAAASAALLAAGLATVLWWDRGPDPRHMSSVTFWFFGGFAALYALVAWRNRKLFLKLDEAAISAGGNWH